MARTLHVVSSTSGDSGMHAVAQMLARLDGGDVRLSCGDMSGFDEVWVHGLWLPRLWKACVECIRARRRGHGSPRLVRMVHGALSPVYLECSGKWKKRMAAPVERLLFRACDRVAVSGPWEEEWCRRWGVEGPFETVDIKRFFRLPESAPPFLPPSDRPMHLLYLGRNHPLKGLDILKAAVADMPDCELRVEHSAFGEDKNAILDWCDVLVLPSLSENFGLVAAEALEHGRRVVVTDGAPAWEGQPGVEYVRGFVEGSPARRIHLLREAVGRAISP
ncbi:MAG: glycosyltransferase [Kiritimatiellae bacterium]|nr:glycosyltransferase [Kiritimatiellia bacterium]